MIESIRKNKEDFILDLFQKLHEKKKLEENLQEMKHINQNFNNSNTIKVYYQYEENSSINLKEYFKKLMDILKERNSKLVFIEKKNRKEDNSMVIDVSGYSKYFTTSYNDHLNIQFILEFRPCQSLDISITDNSNIIRFMNLEEMDINEYKDNITDLLHRLTKKRMNFI